MPRYEKKRREREAQRHSFCLITLYQVPPRDCALHHFQKLTKTRTCHEGKTSRAEMKRQDWGEKANQSGIKIFVHPTGTIDQMNSSVVGKILLESWINIARLRLRVSIEISLRILNFFTLLYILIMPTNSPVSYNRTILTSTFFGNIYLSKKNMNVE